MYVSAVSMKRYYIQSACSLRSNKIATLTSYSCPQSRRLPHSHALLVFPSSAIETQLPGTFRHINSVRACLVPALPPRGTMYTNPLPPPVIREQEYAPLLFAVQPLDQATPRAATPLRADTSSLSTQRRSMPQTPGSMATDATPPPPPPIMRLAEDVVMGKANMIPCCALHSCSAPWCKCPSRLSSGTPVLP